MIEEKVLIFRSYTIIIENVESYHYVHAVTYLSNIYDLVMNTDTYLN